ncbi:MAG: hypothetical protein HKP59_09135 [Lutibacter sp.]|uniref:hypothetical protein n=1 Tax=Lutibacter sp. TaxID=1925666 RepID=UPI0017C7A046|nr:hypothetical protein [Lutibacter sp.]MBT8317781.1 hypothetical protein [Lutibacter sp.]NNJ58639.1 hypothetical protein [Lutibacter sp.]
MTKKILKLISIFGFVMFIGSCANDKGLLTKEYVLEHLAEKEALSPVVFKTKLSNIYIKSVSDIANGSSYYSKLYNDGYLTTQLRSDIPNPSTSYRPYKIVTTQAAEPYILERKPDGTVILKTLKFNAVAVKDIRLLNDFKAEVDVEFKKTKSPFNNPNEKDYAGSGKEYPNDTHVKTLEFRKNQKTNEWKYPIKIIF